MMYLIHIPDDIFTILLEYVHDVGNLVCATPNMYGRVAKNAKFLTCRRLIDVMYVMPNLKKLIICNNNDNLSITEKRQYGIKSTGKKFVHFPSDIEDLTIICVSRVEYLCYIYVTRTILPHKLKILRSNYIVLKSLPITLEEIHSTTISFDKSMCSIKHLKRISCEKINGTMYCDGIGSNCIYYEGGDAVANLLCCLSNHYLKQVKLQTMIIHMAKFRQNYSRLFLIGSLTYLEFRNSTIDRDIFDFGFTSNIPRTVRFVGCEFKCSVSDLCLPLWIKCEVFDDKIPYKEVQFHYEPPVLKVVTPIVTQTNEYTYYESQISSQTRSAINNILSTPNNILSKSIDLEAVD